MERLRAHDQAGARGQVREPAELGPHLCPIPQLADPARRRLPARLLIEGQGNGGVDLAAGAGHPAQAHGALPATPQVVFGAFTGVKSSGQLPTGQMGTVTPVMAALEPRWHGGDGPVQHLRMGLGLVGVGVVGPEHGAESVPGTVERAEVGMEAEATRAGADGALLVLRADLHHQGGAVKHPLVPLHARQPVADRLAGLGSSRLDRSQVPLAELAATAVQGGVRAPVGEEQPPGTEVPYVRAALPAASQQQGPMDHDLASVVEQGALGGASAGVRDHGVQAQAVGEAARGVKTSVGGDLVAAGRHPDAGGASSPHLRTALPAGVAAVSTTPVSPPRGHFYTFTPLNSATPVNDVG